MISSAKLEVQLIIDGCKKIGVKHVVISPGSRNAPFSIAFDEDPTFEIHVVPDERVAAFIALGIAQKTSKPVVVTCTSGSALLNYYPAVSEAFYQEIPLIVLSADRPSEWVDQGDGQTIRQENVYQNMIRGSYQLNSIFTESQRWEFERTLANGLQQAVGKTSGPVHFNVPFSEPLYETTDKIESLSKWIQQAETRIELTSNSITQLKEIWNQSTKRLVIVGQMMPQNGLTELLELLATDGSTAILTEHTSNCFSPYFISCIDRTLQKISEIELERFKPDVIVTIGGAIVSKKIKTFLRNSSAKTIRFGESFEFMDTYKNLVFTAGIKPFEGIKTLVSFTQERKAVSTFGSEWLKVSFLAGEIHVTALEAAPWCDLKVMQWIMEVVPENANLHLSNSSLIRYALLFEPIKSLKYWCNRGTSGIDGSSSTAVGSALASPNELHILITGDLSFFYDSNAWWIKNLPKNLIILLINNGGGDIFNIIPGPSTTNQWKKIFVSEQALEAKPLAELYQFTYHKIQSIDELLHIETQLFIGANEKPTLVEIDTKNQKNSEELARYFSKFN